MAYEHKEGQGSLFKNEKQNDRQPDFKGTILIGGITYEVAAWERISQKGEKYFSLQSSLPRERPATRPSQPAQPVSAQSYATPMDPFYPAPPISADDEDLPF